MNTGWTQAHLLGDISDGKSLSMSRHDGPDAFEFGHLQLEGGSCKSSTNTRPALKFFSGLRDHLFVLP